MYKNKKIVALIPARGGSKGLPGKNIKPLMGKPLISWTIEQALRSKYIDQVVVTTDKIKIARIAKRYGADVPFIRPKELATSSARGIDVLLHAVKYFENEGHNFDLVLWLQPTSPLRKNVDVERAIKMLFRNNAKAVVSVTRSEHHPWLNVRLTSDKRCMPLYKNVGKNKNRQELPVYYRINGAIYLSYIDSIKKTKSFVGKDTCAYIMPSERSVDIDTALDFEFAEFLLDNKDKTR